MMGKLYERPGELTLHTVPYSNSMYTHVDRGDANFLASPRDQHKLHDGLKGHNVARVKIICTTFYILHWIPLFFRDIQTLLQGKWGSFYDNKLWNLFSHKSRIIWVMKVAVLSEALQSHLFILQQENISENHNENILIIAERDWIQFSVKNIPRPAISSLVGGAQLSPLYKPSSEV